MAIYRPPKPRWPLALACAVGGMLGGLLIGLGLGSSEPTARDAGRELQAVLLSAAGSLEVAAVEYQESVEGGEVVAESEYEGALGAFNSSRRRYDSIRSVLASLFPARVEELDARYLEIERLMLARSDPVDVTAELQDLQALLEGDAPVDEIVPFVASPAPDEEGDFVTEAQATLRPRLLRVPESVRMGSDLTYVVQLLNASDEPVPLDPCPAYYQAWGESGTSVSLTGFLNCAGAPDEVPAQGSVRFEMKLPIPERVDGRRYFAGTIVWYLGLPDGRTSDAAYSDGVRARA